MNDDDVTRPVSQRGFSRTEAKRMRNLNTGAIHRMTDGRERTVKMLLEDVEQARKELIALQRHHANALAILEAYARKYGEMHFDRETIQTLCARGRVMWEVLPDRIIVKLRPSIEVVADGGEAVVLDNA